jgi:DNA-binding CsgD family transcriptional regulator
VNELRWCRLALDLIDEGIMVLDRAGRVWALNVAAERQLGCTLAELDPAVPVWEQIDARLEDGTRLGDVLRDPRFRDADSFGPAMLHVVGRHGLVTRGQLNVRSTVDPDGTAMLLAVFLPASGRPWEAAPRTPWGDHAPFAGMTPRQVEILELLMQGQRVPTIAHQLFLSPHTVRNHLKVMFRKAGVRSQVELIEIAGRVRGS